MKLPVPYYSQFVDIQDPFWMLRACGGLCLKMVAEYHGASTSDILTLCNEAREKGGYHMQNGWVHDYLVSKAGELGFDARREENVTNLNDIKDFLKAGNPVIVSVEKRVLEQTRFHMIVLVGYEEETIGGAEGAPDHNPIFYYHETESTDKEKGQYRKVSEKQFLEYFRGKVIYISKK